LPTGRIIAFIIVIGLINAASHPGLTIRTYDVTL
jgi:hypothetical protein